MMHSGGRSTDKLMPQLLVAVDLDFVMKAVQIERSRIQSHIWIEYPQC